jgi:hypothetical protein
MTPYFRSTAQPGMIYRERRDSKGGKVFVLWVGFRCFRRPVRLFFSPSFCRDVEARVRAQR